jgi:c(7)-type cytochrome triheme protein
MRGNWRAILIVVVVAALVGFLGAVVAQRAMAQAKGPPDFTFTDGAMGKVVYSHQFHLSKGLKCTDCHTKIFKMAKPAAFKMADLNNGQFCGACHNGTKAFSVKEAANCSKCHKKG